MINNIYLEHHGVKGQKWGVRRYRNDDHSLKNKKNNKDVTHKKEVGKKVLIGLGITGATAASVAGAVVLKKKAEEWLAISGILGMLYVMNKLSN